MEEDMTLPPHDLLFPPDGPEQFRWTRKAREELGPRFARRGIDLNDLRTSEAIEDAIAKVIVFEYNTLTPEQPADRAGVQRIDDLQFITYPLYGFPRRSRAERRARPLAAMQWVLAWPDDEHSPRPAPPPRAVLSGIRRVLKRLWTTR